MRTNTDFTNKNLENSIRMRLQERESKLREEGGGGGGRGDRW